MVDPFEKMLYTYSNCITYRDEGIVKRSHKPGANLSFRTTFKKNESFCIEWADFQKMSEHLEADVYRIYTRQNVAYNKFPFNGNKVETVDSLENELERSAGISWGITVAVAPLLLGPRTNTKSIATQLRNVRTVIDDLQPNHIRLIGTLSKIDDTEFWLNSGDSSISKIRQHVVTSPREELEVLEKVFALTGKKLSASKGRRYYVDYEYRILDLS